MKDVAALQTLRGARRFEHLRERSLPLSRASCRPALKLLSSQPNMSPTRNTPERFKGRKTIALRLNRRLFPNVAESPRCKALRAFLGEILPVREIGTLYECTVGSPVRSETRVPHPVCRRSVLFVETPLIRAFGAFYSVRSTIVSEERVQCRFVFGEEASEVRTRTRLSKRHDSCLALFSQKHSACSVPVRVSLLSIECRSNGCIGCRNDWAQCSFCHGRARPLLMQESRPGHTNT
jgi:hypothetical protein